MSVARCCFYDSKLESAQSNVAAGDDDAGVLRSTHPPRLRTPVHISISFEPSTILTDALIQHVDRSPKRGRRTALPHLNLCAHVDLTFSSHSLRPIGCFAALSCLKKHLDACLPYSVRLRCGKNGAPGEGVLSFDLQS